MDGERKQRCATISEEVTNGTQTKLQLWNLKEKFLEKWTSIAFSPKLTYEKLDGIIKTTKRYDTLWAKLAQDFSSMSNIVIDIPFKENRVNCKKTPVYYWPCSTNNP